VVRWTSYADCNVSYLYEYMLWEDPTHPSVLPVLLKTVVTKGLFLPTLSSLLYCFFAARMLLFVKLAYIDPWFNSRANRCNFSLYLFLFFMTFLLRIRLIRHRLKWQSVYSDIEFSVPCSVCLLYSHRLIRQSVYGMATCFSGLLRCRFSRILL